MKKILSYSLFLVCLLLTLSLSSTLAAYEEAKATTPRPIEAITDILAWKSIRATVISNDGGRKRTSLPHRRSAPHEW